MSENNEIYAVAAAVTSKSAATMPGPIGDTHIPLASAYLCQDCNEIGDNARTCPACASQVLLGLATVLNRESESTDGAELGSMLPDEEYTSGVTF